MQRIDFLKACGGGCVILLGFSLKSSALAAIPRQESTRDQDQLLAVPKDRFRTSRKGKTIYHPFIIVSDGPYDFPIALYRFSEQEYSALLLRCSHQGHELDAYENLLSCSAHGSEFDNCGNVTSGPAEDALQTFTTSTDETTIYIHLL